MSEWRNWITDPPPRDSYVLVAREPDRITSHEPVPSGYACWARSFPPWFNVAGLLWKPARKEPPA